MLQGQARHDRTVASSHVDRRTGLGAVDEDLGQSTVGEPAEAGNELKAGMLELYELVRTAIR
jgi:hypothetical protein